MNNIFLKAFFRSILFFLIIYTLPNTAPAKTNYSASSNETFGFLKNKDALFLLPKIYVRYPDEDHKHIDFYNQTKHLKKWPTPKSESNQNNILLSPPGNSPLYDFLVVTPQKNDKTKKTKAAKNKAKKFTRSTITETNKNPHVEIQANNNLELQTLLEGNYTNIILTIGNDFIIDGETINILCELIRQNRLQALTITEKHISDDWVILLATALAQNMSLLILRIKINGMSPIGTRAIITALIGHNNLQTLNLTGNEIGPDGAEAFANLIRTTSSLQTLILNYCYLGKKGTKIIAKALEKNNSLITLSLNVNDMGFYGAQAIAAMIRVNKTLRNIHLQENAIPPEGVQEIIKAAKGNCSLKTLDISGNNIGGIAGARLIAELIRTNIHLQNLILNFCKINTAGSILILEALKETFSTLNISIKYNSTDDDTIRLITETTEFNRLTLEIADIDPLTEERYNEIAQGEYTFDENQMEVFQNIFIMAGIEYYLGGAVDNRHLIEALRDVEENLNQLLARNIPTKLLLLILKKMAHIYLSAANLFIHADKEQYKKLSKKVILFFMMFYGLKLTGNDITNNHDDEDLNNDRNILLTIIAEHALFDEEKCAIPHGGLENRNRLNNMSGETAKQSVAFITSIMIDLSKENPWIIDNKTLFLSIERFLIDFFFGKRSTMSDP